MSNSIQQLKDQEQFSFTLNVLNFLGLNYQSPDIASFVYQHDNVKDLNHIKLSEPFSYSVQLKFTNSDEHYGTHSANVTFRSFDGRCNHTGRKTTYYVVEKFESQTLDTSSLYEDLQANFMYLVAEEYYFYTLDLGD